MAADPTYDPTEFQDALRDWMRRKGLSQSSAGYTIGLSPGIINRWLKPRDDQYFVQPTIDSLEKLAPHIGIPLVRLKEMTGNLTPEQAELAKAQAKRLPDHNGFEALVSDIRSQWPDLDPADREVVKDVTRRLLGMHHARSRKPREERPKSGSDPVRSRHLTDALAA